MHGNKIRVCLCQIVNVFPYFFREEAELEQIEKFHVLRASKP